MSLMTSTWIFPFPGAFVAKDQLTALHTIQDKLPAVDYGGVLLIFSCYFLSSF